MSSIKQLGGVKTHRNKQRKAAGTTRHYFNAKQTVENTDINNIRRRRESTPELGEVSKSPNALNNMRVEAMTNIQNRQKHVEYTNKIANNQLLKSIHDMHTAASILKNINPASHVSHQDPNEIHNEYAQIYRAENISDAGLNRRQIAKVNRIHRKIKLISKKMKIHFIYAMKYYYEANKYKTNPKYKQMIDNIQDNVINTNVLRDNHKILEQPSAQKEFLLLETLLDTANVRMLFDLNNKLVNTIYSNLIVQEPDKPIKQVRILAQTIYDSLREGVILNVDEVSSVLDFYRYDPNPENPDKTKIFHNIYSIEGMEVNKTIDADITNAVNNYDKSLQSRSRNSSITRHAKKLSLRHSTRIIDSVDEIPIYFVFLVGGDAHHIHITIAILIHNHIHTFGLGYSGEIDNQPMFMSAVPNKNIYIPFVGTTNPHETFMYKRSALYSHDYMLKLYPGFYNKIVDFGILTPKTLTKINELVKDYNTLTINLSFNDNDQKIDTGFIFTGGDQTYSHACPPKSKDLTNCTKFMTDIFPQINCDLIKSFSNPGSCKSDPKTNVQRINRFFNNYYKNNVAEVVKILNETPND